MKIHLIAGRATDDNIAHARCSLDTQDYKHTLRICNISFTQQQCLHESASMLLFTTYIACLAKRSLLTRTTNILFQRRVSV